MNGRRVNLDQLRRLPSIDGETTDTWRPLHHADLVEQIHEGIQRAGRRVFTEEFYLYRPDSSMLYGFIHTNWRLDNGCSVTLMFRSSTNKSLGFHCVTALRPPNSTNILAHGEAAQFQRRYTLNFSVSRELSSMFDLILLHAGRIESTVNILRYQELTGTAVHRAFFTVFKERILPPAYYLKAIELLNDNVRQHGNTHWGLFNGLAATAMKLTPERRYKALLLLGELFHVYES